MSNSVWQLIVTLVLAVVGGAHIIVTGVYHPEYFVGVAIILAIMGLTMELERER